MKKHIILALLTITTIGSLFAEMDQQASFSPLFLFPRANRDFRYIQYVFLPKVSNAPITLSVGSWLYVKGNKNVELVGGDKIKNEGILHREGDCFVKYEGGIGAKEGTKTTYNASLWKFDKEAYTNSLKPGKRQSPLCIQDSDIHNCRGLWKFQAINLTPDNEPQDLCFTNKNGDVVTLCVIVEESDFSSTSL